MSSFTTTALLESDVFNRSNISLATPASKSSFSKRTPRLGENSPAIPPKTPAFSQKTPAQKTPASVCSPAVMNTPTSTMKQLRELKNESAHKKVQELRALRQFEKEEKLKLFSARKEAERVAREAKEAEQAQIRVSAADAATRLKERAAQHDKDKSLIASQM